MNQPKQPQPNFTMNLNFKHRTNDKQAAITGRISAPEAPETEFRYRAHEHTDKNGETYWIGPVEHARSMRQALNTTAMNGTHFIAIRENGFKIFAELHDGTPNPAYAALTDENKAAEDAKPAFWATWTRGEGDRQLRAAAWEREPNEYGPWASGRTQYPMTKEEVEAMRAIEHGAPADSRMQQTRIPFMDEDPKPAARRRAGKAEDQGRA